MWFLPRHCTKFQKTTLLWLSWYFFLASKSSCDIYLLSFYMHAESKLQYSTTLLWGGYLRHLWLLGGGEVKNCFLFRVCAQALSCMDISSYNRGGWLLPPGRGLRCDVGVAAADHAAAAAAASAGHHWLFVLLRRWRVEGVRVLEPGGVLPLHAGSEEEICTFASMDWLCIRIYEYFRLHCIFSDNKLIK